MNCSCKSHHPIDIEIRIERHALKQVCPFLQSRGYRNITVVADLNTYHAAGKRLSEYLTQSQMIHHLCMIVPNQQGDVVADEASLIQVFLETPSDVDALVAVGAGTIHDIVRFVSFKMNKPFVSVPTAASVDGFTSAGAPLILRGTKKTVQATPPIAVFADLDVLCTAPKHLMAAGFGDMIAKYTSLVDWRFSHIMADEPYCLTGAEWTQQALESCINHMEEIKESKIEGIKVLMQALVQSGLAMLLVGHSRSASGAEHHLSHYWEMDFLKNGKAQVLHGAKVGVATVIITDLYQRVFNQLDSNRISKLSPYFIEMKKMVDQIPEPETLRKLLQQVGGPSLPEELDISPSLVKKALTEAYHLRDRYTVLRFLHEAQLFDIIEF
jgi:glycerol-1-phosphate dehydrogenase [NAD(P)+]